METSINMLNMRFVNEDISLILKYGIKKKSSRDQILIEIIK